MSSVNARAKDLFLDAVELPRGEREAFLRARCGEDAELLERVRGLLAAHERADSVLGGAPTPAPAAESPGLEAGERVGPFTVEALLGHGGFGDVWRARQDAPLRRTVALKVLKAGMDTREVVARFQAERQALALMDHPGIARVFDGGATEQGRPWFAMELVDGPPITEYCERRGLDVRARLRLFLKVCRAVQHAHQKGVVHRDLKPTNVLVAEVDGQPQPKVIDFGIAKAIDPGVTDVSLRTAGGLLLGTPAYMSPEQAGSTADVDTRTDIYSLGVLLYELLCGSTPFRPESLRAAGLLEIQRLIREQEPPRPSARILSSPQERGERETKRLSRSVRGDLDWVVMRCLEKDRERRYESAAVLANELERHLAGEPVLAGPPSLSYRFSKFSRKHRTALLSAVAFAVLLVAGTIAATTQALRAARAEKAWKEEAGHAREEAARAAEAERASAAAAEVAREEERRARIELGKYEAVAGFLRELLTSVDPAVARGRDRTLLRGILDGAAARLAADVDPEVEATLRHTIGISYYHLAFFEEAAGHLRRAYELRMEALGPDDLLTLDALSDLGGVLSEQAEYPEAESVLREAIERRRALLGAEDRRVLLDENNLGTILVRSGRLEEGVATLLSVEATRERVFGSDHEETITTVNSLASALDDLGRKEEALERFEHALRWQLDHRGELHPTTLIAMNNVAGIYDDLGRDEEAEALLVRALAIKRRVLAPEHPSLLIAMSNLGNLYGKHERFAEAEELLGEAHQTALETRGDDDEITEALGFQLGNLRASQDRLREAEGLLAEVLERFLARYGERHPRTMAARHGLADVLARQGRFEEADEHSARALATCDEISPPGSASRGVYRIARGLVLRGLGRDEEALPLLERGFELAGPEAGETWPRRAAESLAALYESRGDVAAADRWRAELAD